MSNVLKLSDIDLNFMSFNPFSGKFYVFEKRREFTDFVFIIRDFSYVCYYLLTKGHLRKYVSDSLYLKTHSIENHKSHCRCTTNTHDGSLA